MPHQSGTAKRTKFLLFQRKSWVMFVFTQEGLWLGKSRGKCKLEWFSTAERLLVVGVGKWTWAGVNIDELLDISPAGLTDGTTSMSQPSKRDCLPGEDAVRNLHYRCITISDVEVPDRSNGREGKGHSVHWCITEVSASALCSLQAGVHELCLAPLSTAAGAAWVTGHKGAEIPDGRCPAAVWLLADSHTRISISLEMHTDMQSHAASSMPSALPQHIKVLCAISINLTLLVLSLFSSLWGKTAQQSCCRRLVAVQ